MRIREERVKAGITQAELAEGVGVSDASVCQWETGKTVPRTVLLPKIASVLGCTVNDLIAEQRSEQ